MKKTITRALAALALSPPLIGMAANIVFSDCGAGAAVGCAVGNDTTGVGTVANPYRTSAQFKTKFQAAAAGDRMQFCQGGAWDGVATGNMANTNATRSNPVVIESVDCSAFWSGGAGIRPKLNNASVAGVLSFNKSGSFHTEGYTVKDIEIVGDNVNTLWGILTAGGADTDYVVIDNVKITGTAVGVQCNAGSNAALTPSGVADGVSQHLTVRNSIFSTMNDIGILSGCSDTLIENNSFANIGTSVSDHSIYLGSGTVIYTSQTISSITGNGTTATLTTATPHLIQTGSHFTISVTGSTSSGSGAFNATNAVGTVTGPNAITYAATGTPSASVVGAYTNKIALAAARGVIRNNVSTNANWSGGLCVESHIVLHGDWNNVLIENNLLRETGSLPTNGACIGIEVDSGGYAVPEDYERFTGLVIRNNTTINVALGIGVDLASGALVENNYHYSDFSTNANAGGIRMRAKNFVPGTVGTSTKPTNGLNPDKNTIRYNTAYLTAPNAGHWGIALNGNVGDPLTGTGHNLYGNVVVLGSSASTTTQCFDTSNMTLAMFDVKDYNACYYLSAAVPKWENTSSLATIQAVGNPNKSDLNSIMASTTSVTADQPFFTAPTTSPTISTSSALKNAGHPTLGPRTGWGGSVRNQGVRDIGSFEFGATLGVVPNSPTNP